MSLWVGKCDILISKGEYNMLTFFGMAGIISFLFGAGLILFIIIWFAKHFSKGFSDKRKEINDKKNM